jgi:protein SCO1/2
VFARVRRWRAIASLALLAVAPACGSQGDSSGDGTRLSGFTRTPVPTVGDLSLPDVTDDGRPLSFVAEPGHVLLVYFGYTQCPDLCPTTLAEVRAAARRLGDDAARIDLAMATVDPARDTPEVLDRFVRSFDPDGHALRTTDDAALRVVAERFGVTYDVTTGADGGIEVSHTTFLSAVDAAGRIVVTWPFGTPIDDLAADLEVLLTAGTDGAMP